MENKSSILLLILIICVVVGLYFFSQTSKIEFDIMGETIVFSQVEYKYMKEMLIEKYENGESFTFREWYLFSAILNREVVNIEGVELKDVEGERLIPLIIKEIE